MRDSSFIRTCVLYKQSSRKFGYGVSYHKYFMRRQKVNTSPWRLVIYNKISLNTTPYFGVVAVKFAFAEQVVYIVSGLRDMRLLKGGVRWRLNDGLSEILCEKSIKIEEEKV